MYTDLWSILETNLHNSFCAVYVILKSIASKDKECYKGYNSYRWNRTLPSNSVFSHTILAPFYGKSKSQKVR